MKHLRVLLCFFLAVSLTACHNNATPIETPDETLEWSDWEMTEFIDKPGLTHFLHYTNNTCGYISVCDGDIYNSFDNPEYFNLDLASCSEKMPKQGDVKRKIVNVGDKIGGLVCTEADITYTEIPEENRSFLSSSNLKFEGEIALSGYIYKGSDDEPYTDENELFFVPDEIKKSEFPIRTCETYLVYEFGDLLVYSPVFLSLGISTAYDNEILASIPQHESVHVEITLNNLCLNYKEPNLGFSRSTASIVDVSIID